MAGRNGTVGHHFECAIQTELVVELELALIDRKQSRRFHTQFHHMPERYERVRVGWHCAKVKGHAELKIEKPRPLVTISPNYTILTPAFSAVASTYANLRQ